MKAPQFLIRVVLVVGGGVLVLLVVGATLLWFFGPDPCGNEIISESPSPDGSKRLVIFQRDCGATTGFSTQASMLPAGNELPSKKGNVFISDTNHGAAPSGPGSGPAVKVTWQSPTSVVLSYNPKVRVFLSESEVSGVYFQYVTEP